MKFLKGLAVAALLAPCLPVDAQVLGTWDGHLPYRNAVSVSAGPDWIYCSTDLAYFQYQRHDKYVVRRHKANGLSDMGAHVVAYDSLHGVLVVTYLNGNLDLVKGDSVRNISDIKTSNVIGQKRINHVHFDGDLAYLSAAFGIVVLDVVRAEIRDTYKPDSVDIEVFATATSNGEIFASTENGLFKAPLVGSNLLDYHSWDRQNGVDNFFDLDIDTGLVVPFDGAIIAKSHDTLMRYDGAAWTFFYHDSGWQPVHLSVTGDQLIVVEHDPSGTQQPTSARVTIIETDGSFGHYMQGLTPVPLAAVLTHDGQLWVADLYHGLKRYELSSGTLESIVPNGPNSNDVFDLDILDGKLWVAAGEIAGTLDFLYNQNGFFSYDGWWTNYNGSTHPELAGTFDWIVIKVDPTDPDRVYIGSHWAGLGILENDQITIFDQFNSPLQGTAQTTHVGALAVDAAGNLWLTNDGAANPLVVRKPDGTWLTFPVPSISKDLFDLVIDDFGQVWSILPRGLLEGLVVYDPGSDLESTSDDEAASLNTQLGHGALPANGARSIAKDLDGEIWVGTPEGVGVFRCPSEVLNDGCDADKIIVERDGFLGYLLEAEVVFAIAVDGANRKWVGTENGVFLLSEDGTDEIFHFTEANSPLFSNVITDIVIDHTSGLVWIGTAQGLNSFQGDAIAGAPTHDCFINPNPVRPDYNELIVIKGLVQDADVRITDVAGNLVYHTIANGGMATWDGKLLDGSRAHTGVYYVFSTNSDGSDRTACKLLFVN